MLIKTSFLYFNDHYWFILYELNHFRTEMNKKFLILILWVTAYGCYWENEETLFPDAALCDTTSVSFSGDIVPILTNNCYSCHSNNNAQDFGNGITFEDYEDVLASASLITGAINHSDGFPQMPKNRTKLDDCLIITFEAWVNQGGLDN